MSKKKPLENTSVHHDSEEQKTDSASENNGGTEHPIPPGEGLGELAQEVQTFLNRRVELSQKLHLEIEATERKLAELKKTLEMLSFHNGVDSSAEKERTDKKLKKAGKIQKSKQGASDKLSSEQSESETTTSTEGHPPSGGGEK